MITIRISEKDWKDTREALIEAGYEVQAPKVWLDQPSTWEMQEKGEQVVRDYGEYVVQMEMQGKTPMEFVEWKFYQDYPHLKKMRGLV